jgi:hypothetical protein
MPVMTLEDDCLLQKDVRGLPWPGHEVDEDAIKRADAPIAWTAEVAQKADQTEAASV